MNQKQIMVICKYNGWPVCGYFYGELSLTNEQLDSDCSRLPPSVSQRREKGKKP